MKKTLKEYNFPEELKSMSMRELELLSYEIRDFLIENVSKTGGHLASNLGVVELTIALHAVFDSPKDKIIWDVGHQSYVHKLLTGRADQFDTLRQFGGLSGFPRSEESLHDVYATGHSSTSISAASGFAAARDLDGEDYSVTAVIGDGALTGGLAYEALNNAGDSNSKMIVVLNDNGMSISVNTGGMSNHLNKLRTSKTYQDFKKQVKKTLKGIPNVGEGIYSGIEHLRDSLKYAIVDGALFEEIGFTYLGPIDGHNIESIMETLQLAKNVEGPVLIHAITKKGKGYRNAETNPNKFHGIGPFDPTTGALKSIEQGHSYSQIFGNKLVQLGDKNKKIVAVCAAMTDGTGLEKFADKFPERFFDVGIAEAHAVVFAAGMAKNGYTPVVAIYSAFLQRAYDPLLVDVCLQNLPVIFAVDRAGIVGADGETHHGIFDLSYFNHMPNMTVLAPKDGKELALMLEYAVNLGTPCAIRYPKGSAVDLSGVSSEDKFSGKSQVLIEGSDAQLWAVGDMVSVGIEACRLLKLYGYDVGLVNAGVIKPIDQESLLSGAKATSRIITLENNVAAGGFGQSASACILEADIPNVRVKNLGWPNQFIEQGGMGQLMKKYGLDSQSVAERIREFIERKA